jgi:hypothetical protein
MRSAMGRMRILASEEQDCYTGWRKLLIYTQRAGVVKSVKRRTHKRMRREGKREARDL